MDYQTAIDYLFSLEFFGVKLGLANINRLLELCGNPQNNQKIIQIAGTNGKGSVAAMLETILQSAGYRVGLFTSPHLVDFAERIRINQKNIPRDKIGELTGYLLPGINQIAGEPGLAHPTYFEVNTAMALLYFHQEKTDWSLLEVGMGGRLDATSAVTPRAVIITNISLDHQRYLGDNIRDIAYEKAGTIKQNVPVFTRAAGEALEVIMETCRRKNAPLISGDKLGKIIKNQPAKNGQLVSLETRRRRYDDLFIPLPGPHQADNALLAVNVADYLGGVSEEQVKKGLARTFWPGRIMIIGENPLIIIDGAHNTDSMEKLKHTIKQNFPHQRLIVVLAFLADKNVSDVLRSILSTAAEVIVTEVGNSKRALPADTLAAMVNSEGVEVTIKRSSVAALNYARSIADAADLILICGSLYLAGELLEQRRPLSISR